MSSLAAAINGISVFDWSNPEVRETIRPLMGVGEDFDLKYDQMVVAERAHGVVVGEEAHFLYRLEQIKRNNECRRAATARICREASRILGGVSWLPA